MLIGYARVSKGDAQTTAPQLRALEAAGVKRTFQESASGGRWDRPELHRMLDQVRGIDVVVVWKLDRLSRSLKDLLHILERIEAAGAGFRSLTEAIDTTTPAGRMMMQMIGSFGPVRARHDPRAHIRRPRRRPRRGPDRRTPPQAHPRPSRADVVENVISGRRTAAQMARLYKVSEPTISRILAAARAGRITP